LDIKILLEKKDLKIKKDIYLCELDIETYLNLVEDSDAEDFDLQRVFLGMNSYKRLILDMILGADIPSMALVHNNKKDVLAKFKEDKKFLFNNERFLILDGIQRTACLKIAKDIITNPSKYKNNFFNDFENEINENEMPSLHIFLNYPLTIFIWENLDLNDMLYKMVVLNTGQRKMSDKHQLDILSSEIKENMVTKFALYTEKEIKNKKIKPKSLIKNGDLLISSLSEGVVSYIKESPVKNKADAVEYLFERLSDYKGLLNENLLGDLQLVINIHSKFYIESDANKEYLFSQYEPLLIGFLSALGKARNYTKLPVEKLDEKIANLEKNIMSNDWNEFIIYYTKFKSAIGYKRRHFSFKVFLEYFRNPYDDNLDFELAYSSVK